MNPPVHTADMAFITKYPALAVLFTNATTVRLCHFRHDLLFSHPPSKFNVDLKGYKCSGQFMRYLNNPTDGSIFTLKHRIIGLLKKIAELQCHFFFVASTLPSKFQLYPRCHCLY